jgi:sugar lactone lactonase YvrE
LINFPLEAGYPGAISRHERSDVVAFDQICQHPAAFPLAVLMAFPDASRVSDNESIRNASRARLLAPDDDVATALADLTSGTRLRVAHGAAVHDVTLVEPVRLGHKFAVRALSSGMRVRKYGEFIGRTTVAIAAGAWVHEHNLVTTARHDPRHEGAWRRMQRPARVEACTQARAAVGGSPVYDERTGRVWWVDVRETPAIHRLDPATGHECARRLEEDIGSLVLTDDEPLLLALHSGFAFFDPASGAITPIVDPQPTARTRLGDGKCDAAGRFWSGSTNPESGLAEGSLYVLDASGCRAVSTDWLMPNGMAWSRDGRTMYMADTRCGVIHAWPFDVATGALGQPRVFADLGAYPGLPDGATVDADDHLWSAQLGGGCLMRFAPDGTLDRVVRLPVSRPTSCTFGGRDCRTLFVTTATRGLDAEQRRREPLAGQVLALDVGVAGSPAMRYRTARTA